MRIPPDASIVPEKLINYLLAFRTRNDKSRLLNQIGFSIDAPEVLEAAIRAHCVQRDAVLDRRDVYGEHFVVDGSLQGPTGTLPIRTVWVRRSGESVFRFVTLRPSKEQA